MSMLRLNEYPATPLYNIKAVVQATGISPSTLRAWERRYKVCQPQRTESGYRLYSDRDIAMIRWLKVQVDAGMAISQAVSWLDSLAEEAAGLENVALPGLNGSPLRPVQTPAQARRDASDSGALIRGLVNALLRFDEQRAEAILTEAFGLYPLEYVGEEIVTPALIEIGERWHNGEISVTLEHYATNYLIQRLAVLLRGATGMQTGPLIWVACAPSELHEIGALLLVIYLRRAGHRVHYMGKDIPVDDFVSEVQRARPAMVLLSASMPDSVVELATLTAALLQIDPQPPFVGYGGRVFRERPTLRDTIAGVYMGDTAYEAVANTNERLRVGTIHTE